MDVNTYTLSLIDNYVAATGQEILRRSTLSPADYLLFRKQAVEECQRTSLFTMATPMVQPQMTTPPKPVKSVPNNVPFSTNTSSDTDYEYDYEEDDENDLEVLLKSVPG